MSGPSPVRVGLLALLLPALLLLSAGAWLAREAPSTATPLTPAARVLDGRLAGRHPRVVLLGNSKVHSDIDRDSLVRAMGLRRADLVDLSVVGATTPSFYAILRRRVYDAGEAPALVLVYGAADHFLDTTLESAVDRARVEDQLGGRDDPVLAAKVFGRPGGAGAWDRARRRRTELHGALLDGLRDHAVGWLLSPPGPEPAAVRGAATAAPALERLFGADATPAQTERVGVGPIVEREQAPTVAGAASIDQTLVPDLVALAQSHGARVVFVRAPMRTDGADAAGTTQVGALVAALNAAGAGWVDLSGLPLGGTDFKDRAHMSASGKARLSAALAAALEAMDPLGAASIPRALSPLVPSGVSRTGTGPPLTPRIRRTGRLPCTFQADLPELDALSDTALGQTGPGAVSPLQVLQDGVPLVAHASREAIVGPCAGASAHVTGGLRWTSTDRADAPHTWTVALDPAVPTRNGSAEAWWVYPGTRVRWSFDPAWEADRGSFQVAAAARVAVPGTQPAGLRVVDLNGGTREVPLTGGPFVAGWVDGTGPGGPWVLELGSPADGPWLLVERVEIGTGPARTRLVGGPSPGVQILPGRSSRTGDPPVLSAPGPVEARGTTRFFPLSGPLPPDDPTLAAAGFPACSPLQARFGETLLPHRPAGTLTADGSWRHTAGGLEVAAAGPRLPAGSAPSVSLDPVGRCDQGTWFYPGGTTEWPADRPGWRRLGGAPAEVRVVGRGFGATDPLVVALVDRGVEVATWEVSAGALEAGPVSLPFPADRVPDRPLGVRVHTPAGAWFLLHELSFRDARPTLPGDLEARP